MLVSGGRKLSFTFKLNEYSDKKHQINVKNISHPARGKLNNSVFKFIPENYKWKTFSCSICCFVYTHVLTSYLRYKYIIKTNPVNQNRWEAVVGNSTYQNQNIYLFSIRVRTLVLNMKLKWLFINSSKYCDLVLLVIG